MTFLRKNRQRRRVDQGRVFCIEALEERALLAASAETFTGPSLNDLIVLTQQGENTAPAAIDRVVEVLATQLTSGPLTDLTDGAVDGNGFVTRSKAWRRVTRNTSTRRSCPSFPTLTHCSS